MAVKRKVLGKPRNQRKRLNSNFIEKLRKELKEFKIEEGWGENARKEI